MHLIDWTAWSDSLTSSHVVGLGAKLHKKYEDSEHASGEVGVGAVLEHLLHKTKLAVFVLVFGYAASYLSYDFFSQVSQAISVNDPVFEELVKCQVFLKKGFALFVDFLQKEGIQSV